MTIYLDYAATSPMHPEVIAQMVEAMTIYGNPSSVHQIGRHARKAVDEARVSIAKSIGAKDTEIIFTSGGTEADNTAIFGVAYAQQHKGKHIITTQIEHHAVLHACEKLEKEGFDITYLPVDSTGRVCVTDVQKALREDTILVTIMLANNEVGTIQPIAEIGQLLATHSAIFHTDAVQAYGVLPIDVEALGVDYLSVSAHKIGGPKGIGFLYQRSKAPFKPLLHGGQQERMRRASTENVPAIIAFATAVTVKKTVQYETFKKRMEEIWQNNGIMYRVNGVQTLPQIFNVSFVGTDVEAMLVNLDMAGICVSSGSACTAGAIDPSHVLVAMYGEGAPELRNAIRFSFGFATTIEEIEQTATTVAQIVSRLVNL